MNQLSLKEQLQTFLTKSLAHQTDVKAMEWLLLQKNLLESNNSEMKFFMAFSQASRYFSKKPLLLNKEQKSKANELEEGFKPDTWDQLQTARSLLMLFYPADDASKWLVTFQKLFETADVHEQQSLYAALPIMPFPEAMTERAIEGLRTNMTSVFDAIVLNNPFPYTYLSESSWNQMVVKSVFLQRPLYKIYNVDLRANQNLTSILIDFAHERRAAGRTFTPELWRLVRHYLNEDIITDLHVVIDTGSPLEKKAAILACHSSGHQSALQLIESHPDLQNEIKDTSWDDIGREHEESIGN